MGELKVASKVLETTISNATLSYSPAQPTSQELVRIGSITAKLPQFQNVSASITGLSIRGNGFSLDNATVSISTVALMGVISVTTPTLTLTNVSYAAASGSTPESFSGTITLSAGAATLFPGRKFTANVTPVTAGQAAISGSYNLATGQMSLTAGQVALSADKFFTASATNVAINYDPALTGSQTIATIASLSLTVKPLRDQTVTVTNLAIRTDGFAFDNLTTTLPNISLGGYLQVVSPSVTLSGISLTQNDSGSVFTGNLTLAADSASLFPGKSFSASITPITAGQRAITGTFNLNTGAFALTAGKFDVTSDKFFSATAQNIAIAFDPAVTTTQTIVSIASVSLTVKPLRDSNVTVTNLSICI
jgi:hypothetical protein